MSLDGKYLAINALNCAIPGSLSQAGSPGSLQNAPDIMPMAFSGPAGCRTDPTDMETFVMKNVGLHPMSYTLRTACAANLGTAATSSVSAPDACRSAS